MMYHQDCFRSIVVLRSLRKRKVASSILAGSLSFLVLFHKLILLKAILNGSLPTMPLLLLLISTSVFFKAASSVPHTLCL
jgi:hypothetical protein